MARSKVPGVSTSDEVLSQMLPQLLRTWRRDKTKEKKQAVAAVIGDAIHRLLVLREENRDE